MWYSLIRIPLLFYGDEFVNYKKMYEQEHATVEQLKKRNNYLKTELDKHFRYIQKQNVIIQLLKENIKELKGQK